MIIPFRRPGRARQVKRNMPEQTPHSELDRLLGFQETLPDDAFVLNVMHRLARERRRRRLILFVFGLIGAAFGLVGAVLLSEPLATLFSGLPPGPHEIVATSENGTEVRVVQVVAGRTLDLEIEVP